MSPKNMTKEEILDDLSASHVAFVKALLNDDGQLALLAYGNYARYMAILLTKYGPKVVDDSDATPEEDVDGYRTGDIDPGAHHDR